MVEETGIVKKVDGLTAIVLVQRKGACEGCVVKGACKTTDEGAEIEALNPVKAKVGQKVRLSMTSHSYLKGSMIVYGMPLVIFIAAAILGKNIGGKYLVEFNSDLIAAISAILSLIISYAGIRLWSMKAEKRSELQSVIEEIIE